MDKNYFGYLRVGRLAVGLIFLILAFFLFSCGSPGGGDDELNPAEGFLQVSPQELDSGDRTRVTAFLDDIPSEGVVVKFRLAAKLSYVEGSTTLEVGDDVKTFDPDFDQVIGSGGRERRYLVFDLPGELFAGEVAARLSFLLEGEGTIKSGQIEIDTDLNDPTLSFSEKFSSALPQFDVLESVEINVSDQSGFFKPTVTPTPTITNTPTITPTARPTRTPRPTATATTAP